MYSIIAMTGIDPYEVYDDRFTDEKYAVIDPKLILEDNSAGSLTFTITPKNNCYGLDDHGAYKLQRLKTDIYVKKYDRSTGKNKIIWGGRIISDDYDFYNNRTITCEGTLAFLNDTVNSPKTLQYIPICAYLDQYINIGHNQSVPDNRKIHIRINKPTESVQDWTSPDISVVDLWAGLSGRSPVFQNDYETTSSCLQKLLDYYGGHVWIEYEEIKVVIPGMTRYFVNAYLHWSSTEELMNEPYICDQQIVFGENLLDYASNYDSTNFATVLLPLGCTLNDDERPTSKGADPTRDWNRGNYRRWSNYYYGPQNLTIDYSLYSVTNNRWVTYPLLENVNPDWNLIAPYDPYIVWVKKVGDTYQVCDKNDTNAKMTPYVTLVKLDPATGEPVRPLVWECNTSGWKVVTQTWSDIEDTLVLLTKAVSYLKNLAFNDLVIDLTAADLKDLGVFPDEDAFSFLHSVHVLSIPHGLDKDFLISRMEIDLDQPGNNTISLTASEKVSARTSLTDILAQTEQAASQRRSDTRGRLQNE